MIKSPFWVFCLCFFLFAGTANAVSPTKAPTPTKKATVKSATTSAKLASPTPIPFGANWFETAGENDEYALLFDWTSIANVRGYSIEISKNGGAAPQKKITTVRTEWNFKNVTPGEWYINMIAQKKDRTWTDVYFWKVQVGPPQPTEAPEPEVTDEEQVLSVKTKVEQMLKKAGRSLSTSNLLDDSDEEDPLDEDIPVLKKKFVCDCEKSCKTIRSCAEANFLLFQCGCAHLDADDDSIPCENKCG